MSLNNTTKLDAKTPLTFLSKTLEYNQQEHSISLHLPSSYYMKLLKMYGMEEAKATSTLAHQLCQSEGPRNKGNKTLALSRQKLYRTAVGQLLWATPVRPDISFAVKELSRSLQAPTRQDEQQLKQVLRYLKGTLHFSTSLQPPRKRVIERASSIHIQACFDSALEGSKQTKKSTSGATLSLWGVPLAASSRTQASQASSTAEAELLNYAMGMAVQDSLHLKILLQEMQLSQLAKSSSLQSTQTAPVARLLASKLGLSKKSRHVQLRCLFKQDPIANGQLQLSKIPAEKNQATVLTKHLSASTLHRLLPKLGVRTRAADSKDLLPMVSEEVLASSREEKSSFFIGMMAQQLVTAQLVPPSVASRACQDSSLQKHFQESSFQEHSQEAASRDGQGSSLQEHDQEEVQSLKASQRTVSRSSFATLLCATIFAVASFTNFKFYSLLLYFFEQRVSRSAFWPRASRTPTSSSASKSLSATSLQRKRPTTWWMPRVLVIIFFSFLGDTALNLPVELVCYRCILFQNQLLDELPYLQHQRSSCRRAWPASSRVSLSRCFLHIELPTYQLAGWSSFQQGSWRQRSLQNRSQKSLKSTMMSLQTGTQSLKSSKQTLKLRTKSLQSTAKSLKSRPTSLKRRNKELEEQQAGLAIALIKTALLQLAEEEKELDFNMMIGEEACKSFRQMASTQLPQQEVKGAWLAQLASEQQLIIGSLNIGFDNFIVKYAAFKKNEELSHSFSESSLSENSLQTSLAKSMQWPSLFSKSSTRLMAHQLLQHESALGSQDPRACTAAFQRPCWQHNDSLLASQHKVLEQQLSQELMKRVLQLQLCKGPSGRMACSFPIACSVEKP